MSFGTKVNVFFVCFMIVVIIMVMGWGDTSGPDMCGTGEYGVGGVEIMEPC